MRRNILLLTLLPFVAIVFATLPALADPIVVSIQPALSTPDTGTFFDVAVDISAVVDLYAFQFDITFDPTILSAVAVTEGPFLADDGFTFFIPGTIDNTTGIVSFTADTLLSAPLGVSDSGTLADLTFQALALGSSPVDLSNLILLDSTPSDISFSTTGGVISPVGTVNPVPEPSIVLLLGSALIGLATMAKRKFNE